MSRPNGARNRPLITLTVVVGTVLVLLVAILVGAVAIALGSDSGAAAQKAAPAYQMNAKGQTFGVSRDATTDADAPDLIRAMADNGKIGYVSEAGLNGPAPSSAEDAAALTDAGLRGREIPVYESDGVTQIGVFTVGGPGSECGGAMDDGSSWTKVSNADGTITTTIRKTDGSLTKTTE